MDILAAERRIGYKFKNKSLLKRAFTLASFDAESNNEALEFFGDAVLEFIVSESIFSVDADEGELTERRKSLVCDKSLERVSRLLGLDKFLIKDAGDTRNKKAVSSVYEAVTAAIYLDGGMDKAKKFVLRTLDFGFRVTEKNYKGELQEALQKRGCGCPEYKVTDCGTPQNPNFFAKVCVMGKTFTGEGGSKQQAERQAAKNALESLFG